MGEYLKGKGFGSSIFAADDGAKGDSGRPSAAHITMMISTTAATPAHGFGISNDCPMVRVMLDKANAKVAFVTSTMVPGRGGVAGGSGDALLASVNSDIIEAKITEIIAKVFS
jgi:hypothetical protein